MAKAKKKKPSDEETASKKPKAAEDKKRGATGASWGLNVGQTWLRLLEQNPRKKLTDPEMAKFMQSEFPDNKDYTVADITLHRNLFNRGRIRDQEPFGKELPDDEKLHEYQDKDGKLVKLPLRAARKAAAKKKAKTEDVADDANFEEEEGEEEEGEEEEEEAPAPKKRKRRKSA